MQESSDNHMIIDFCLNEIVKCQQTSAGPNFVIMIGEKYGYRPFPPHIVDKEFEMIRSKLPTSQIKLIDKWYQKDENIIPNLYRLRPISTFIPNYNHRVNIVII